MPDQLRSPGRVRLDVLQSVKRGAMHLGLIIGKKEAPSPKHRPAQESNDKMPSQDGSIKTTNLPGLKKSEESKSAKGPDTLTELTENSQDILYEATTVFPFTLFPDTISLDREKLTIANRLFWRTANITSTPISEIMTVEANVGPFFGSIHLTFRFFADNQRTVPFLTRSDATNLQRLLHGYIIAHRREIDCTNVDTEDLKKLLSELGQGASD